MEPLGLPSDSEKCWTDWLPEFEKHPAKKNVSVATRHRIEFAAKRRALLRRGEVEPATTGSAQSAPCQCHMSSPHLTFTWRALPGTTRQHFQEAAWYAWPQCQMERSLMDEVGKACEEARKKHISPSAEPAGSSSTVSLASIADKVMES